MAEKKAYHIYIHHTLVSVSKEIYQVYYSGKRCEKTLSEKDERNGLVSYDALDTGDILGEEMIPDVDAPSVEEIAVANVLHDKLRRCLALLPPAERELIEAIYFEGLSERQVSKQTSTPQKTVHDRKCKILAKLNILINQ